MKVKKNYKFLVGKEVSLSYSELTHFMNLNNLKIICRLVNIQSFTKFSCKNDSLQCSNIEKKCVCSIKNIILSHTLNMTLFYKQSELLIKESWCINSQYFIASYFLIPFR